MNDAPNYPGPKAGGAWLVLFERFQPMKIQTRGQAEELGKQFDKIRVWAESQESDVTYAYKWAMTEILANTLERVGQAAKYAASQAAYHEIPRPPES